MFIVKVSQDTELYELIESYSEDGLEIATHWWHLGRDAMFTVQVS